jgi:predicted ATPase
MDKVESSCHSGDRTTTMRTRAYLSEVSLKPSAAAYAQDFPFTLPVVRALDRLAMHPNVTFLVGENGSGKSTLLEAIAVAMGFNAEGGSRNFNFATRESHSNLHEHLRLVRGISAPRDPYFLRAESFFNVSSEIERLGVVSAYGGPSTNAASAASIRWRTKRPSITG